MKNSIAVPFGADKVRMVEIEGEPWFVGKDVAEILGYANPRDALAKHVDDEDKNTVAIHDGTPGNPNTTIINEAGLYGLIFFSKLPAAKKFKHWVTHEVLPSIRKYGFYECARTELTGAEISYCRSHASYSQCCYEEYAREKFKKEYYSAYVYYFHTIKKSEVEQAIEARRDLRMLQIYDDERYVQYDQDCIRLSKYGLESLRRFKVVPIGNEFEMLEADIAAHNKEYYAAIYVEQALNELRQRAARRFQIEG